MKAKAKSKCLKKYKNAVLKEIFNNNQEINIFNAYFRNKSQNITFVKFIPEYVNMSVIKKL